MAYFSITLSTSLVRAELITEALAELILASAYDIESDIPVIEAEHDTTVWLSLWVAEYPDASWVERHLKPFFDTLPALHIEPIPEDRDWVRIVQEHYQPFTAGLFTIHPSNHLPEHVQEYRICIDAGPAFGTGEHATTFSCLEAISELSPRSDGPMLDLGTGSGILAIALAKRFQRPVIATDIDPQAVETARYNSIQNQAIEHITAIQADGFSHPLLEESAPFAVIVANILATPLKTVAPAMAAHIAPGGDVILSGLLTHQAEEVLAAYTPQGFILERQWIKEPWVCLWLRFRKGL